MFDTVRKSWKQATAERLVRQKLGYPVPAYLRPVMHDSFSRALDSGGNEFDAAIMYVLMQLKMIAEGVLPEQGLIRTEPLSDEEMANIQHSVGVIERLRSKAKFCDNNNPGLDLELGKLIALTTHDPLCKEDIESFAADMIQEIEVAIADAADAGTICLVGKTLRDFRTAIGREEAIHRLMLAADYKTRGYSVEDAALLFLDGTVTAIKKSSGQSIDDDAVAELEHVIDSMFFDHMRRSEVPVIMPRNGHAARPMDKYMREP